MNKNINKYYQEFIKLSLKAKAWQEKHGILYKNPYIFDRWNSRDYEKVQAYNSYLDHVEINYNAKQVLIDGILDYTIASNEKGYKLIKA